tara:strand:+ start:273 stop:464 length:192 start_codon:yes stop_codon:yes gene_type:complete
MLLLGKIALYIAGIAAGLLLLIPIVCIIAFIVRNAMYIAEILVDGIVDGLNWVSQIFKRKHKK